MIQRLITFVIIIGLLCCAMPVPVHAAVCSNPGKDLIGNPSGVINSYYAGSGTVWAGLTAITLATNAPDTSSGGSATAIAAGDLLMVMQMQDADISTTNDSNYGGSVPGSGYISANNSGVYEYVVATGPVSGLSVPIASPLLNTYRSAAASASAGKRTFQVIRVPQYSSATLGANLTAAYWNGTVGGVVAFDAAGQLNWGGQTINVTGRGFRGGGGRNLNGQALYTRANALDYRTLATVTANGSKGEGIAGTPQYVFTPTTAGPVTNGAGAVTNTGTDGYPNGSYARGAPGNAGGGGSDGNPVANDENTGGGGGGGYSVGGMGGYGWTPGIPPGSMTGGFGGYAVAMAPGLLTMGGGGGAGSMNNNTGTPANGPATSGAAGGGVVIIRAGTIIGSGTINVNGTNANNTITNDASGGGGGGGAVLVFASNGGGSIGSLSVNARGGNGGDNTGGGAPHGPGGGGSGGYVALTSAAAVDVSGGANGTTAGSTTSTPDYGSTSSAGGYQLFTILPTQIPGAAPNALCYPLLTVTKTTLKANTVPGSGTGYTITVSNLAGKGDATGVRISDLLPTPFIYGTLNGVTMAGGATRPSTTNPGAGASSLAWDTFTIPGGGSVTTSFTVNVPAGTSVGTYQNPASVTYTNPAAGSPGAPATVTPGGTYYTGSVVVGGSNYDSASSTQEDVTVWQPVQITKSFSNILATSARLSVSIVNPNSSSLTSTALTDSYPAGMTTAAVPNISQSGCGVLPTTSASTVSLTGATIAAGGTCTFAVDVSFSAGSIYTNTIPPGALSNTQNVTNSTAASATLNATGTPPPAISKSFTPSVIQQGGTSTLTFTIVNPSSTAMTGVNFTDTYPAGLINATPLTMGGTCLGQAVNAATIAGAGVFNLTAANIPANSSCTVTVLVTSAAPSSAAGYSNTTSGVKSTESGAAVGPVSNAATLQVAGTPSMTKVFGTNPIAPGGSSVLTFTITNTGNIALTGANFSDNLINMSVNANQSAGGTCAGAASNNFTAGQAALNFSGLTIPSPAGSTCTVTVNVTSSTSGNNPNTSSGVVSVQTPVPGTTAFATLQVLYSPDITKDFFPSSIVSGGTSTLTFTLSNPGTTLMDGVSFSDTLVNMKINAAGAAGGTCTGAGSNSFVANQTALNFSGISIASKTTCTVTVVITSSTSSPAGGHPNTTSGATSNQTPVVGPVSNTAYLTVLTPPSIAKSFSPTAITTGGTSTITFTLTNANFLPLTGVKFIDQFPTNLDLTTAVQSYIGGSRGTCVTAIPAGKGAGANPTPGQMIFNAVTIPANSSCTLMVDVTSATAAVYNNIVSAASGGATAISDQTGAVPGPNSNTATLTVAATPSTNKAFAPSSINSGGTSTLTITLNVGAAATLTAPFTDTLTGGMTIAAANSGTCAGVTATVGTSVITKANGSAIPAGGCTIIVSVTSSTPGTVTNTINAGDLKTTAGNNAAPSSATLTVNARPTVTKSFSPASIASGGTSTLTITLGNSNATPATLSAIMTDTLPAGMTVATPNGLTGTCNSGTTTATAGAGSVSYNNGAIIPAGGCTIIVDVTSSTGGVATNTIAAGALQTNFGNNAVAATVTLNVSAVSVTKAFASASIATGGTSTLTITLGNTSGAVATLSAALTDTLPAGVTVAGVAGGSCAGAKTAVLGSSTVTYASGATIPAAGCTITVLVTSSTPGAAVNTIPAGALQTSRGNSLSAATATLAVGRIDVVKSFSPVSTNVNGTTDLVFDLTNTTGSDQIGITLRDQFPVAPAAMVVDTPLITSNTCGGVLWNFAAGALLTTGDTGMRLIGGTLAANSTCKIAIRVRVGASAGTYSNQANNITFTGWGGGVYTSNTVTLLATAPPTITKTFAAANIASGGNTNLTATIGNTNAAAITLSNLFTDSFPVGMTIGTAGNSGTCSGVTATSGASSFTIANGTSIPAGGCTVIVNVTSTTPGAAINTIPAVSLQTSAGNNAAASFATLNVYAPPSVAKSFAANIATGGNTIMTIVVSNPAANPGSLTGVSTNDAYTGTLSNFAAGSISCSGGSSATLTGGVIAGTSVGLNSGTIIPGGSCTITQSVTATSTNNNTTGAPSAPGPVAVSGTPAGPITLNVYAPPTIVKAFGAATIGVAGSTALNLTVTNPNTTTAISGIAFTDNLPAGLTAVNGSTATCGGTLVISGTNLLTFTGGTLAASANCIISTTVTGSTAGVKNNTTGIVSASGPVALTGLVSNTTSVTVSSAPTIVKSFAAANVALGGSVNTSFLISNSNTTALSGIAFVDNLPAGLSATNGSTAICGGNLVITGTNTLTFSGGTLAASPATCTITVPVTGTVAGVQNNTTGVISSIESGSGAASNTATINIYAPPSVTKSFAPASVSIGGTSTMTITVTNPAANVGNLTGVSIADTYGGTLANNAAGSVACSGAGSATLTGGINLGTTVGFNAGTIVPGGTCTITQSVTATSTSANTTGIPTTTGPVVVPGSAAGPVTLTVAPLAPTVSKAFAAANLARGGNTNLTVTIGNTNAGAITLSALFTDSFPAGMTINTAGNTGTCGGVTATAADTKFTIANGTSIPAGGCTVIVNVTSSTAGAATNSIAIGALQTSGGSNAAAATATVNIYAPPTVTKVFTPASVSIGGTSSMTITVTNPAANPGNLTGVSIADSYIGTLVNNAAGSVACSGAGSATLTGGINGGTSVGFNTGTIVAGGSCTITQSVSATATANNTTGVPAATGPVAVTGSAVGPVTLTVNALPAIAKAFSPATVDIYSVSTMTFTISNSNSGTLTSANFTDTLTGFSVAAPATIGGTCLGVSNSPALAAGATALNLTVPNLAAGSCTITIPVSATSVGIFTNTSSGITTVETGASVGPPSNTTTLTVVKQALQVTKAPSVITATPGSTVSYVISYSNPNASTWFQNIIITDPIPVYTTFQSAICGPLPLGITSCTISAPAVGGTGAVTWTLGGKLDAGLSGTVTLSVRVD